MINKIIQAIFSPSKKKAIKIDFEWERYRKTAKEQFIWLREKGIRFPIVFL